MSVLTLQDAKASFFIPKREQGVTANLVQGTILGLVLTALSYWIGLEAGWIASLSILEAFAVFTSYVCTFLCVMERRINYPIGAVSTVAYCVLFAQSALFASMAINAFLSVYLVYGWLRWKSDENTLSITNMSWLSWILTIVVAGTGYLAVVGLATWLGGALAWTDSLILVGTIMAQFMMDNKKIENWAVWALVNVFAIYTYFHAGLALAGFQYIFFLLNTWYGYVMWRKGQHKTGYSGGSEDGSESRQIHRVENCTHQFVKGGWQRWETRLPRRKWRCTLCGFETRTYDALDSMAMRPVHPHMSLAVPGFNTEER